GAEGEGAEDQEPRDEERLEHVGQREVGLGEHRDAPRPRGPRPPAELVLQRRLQTTPALEIIQEIEPGTMLAHRAPRDRRGRARDAATRRRWREGRWTARRRVRPD